MIRNTALGVIALATLLAGTAQAGIFDPAYKGAPNSVNALFEWDGGNSFDLISFSEGAGATFPLDTTPVGIVNNAGVIEITLPNYIDPLPLKLIRIQYTVDGIFDSGFDPEATAEVDGVDPTGAVIDTVVGSGSDGFNNFYVDFELRPNPDYEVIKIFTDPTFNFVPGNLLGIEIDTISIPEPTSLALLATGALAILRRR